jgi:hypothetical protein
MEDQQQFNAFIIGAQKAASSSLHFLLLEHAEVCARKDELPVFEDPFYSEAVVAETFDEHRTVNDSASVYLLKRPNLLCTGYIPSRVHAYNPDTKLICILRDPASRAVSSILHYMKSGLLPVQSMNAAIDSIVFRNEVSDYGKVETTVLEYGLYGKHLENWLSFFKREQFLFLKQEEMRDLDESFTRVCDFLAIQRMEELPSLSSTQGKVAVNSMLRLRLSSMVAKAFRKSVGKSMYTEWRFPSPVFRGLAHLFTVLDRVVLAKLSKPSECLKPSSEMLSRLREYYAVDLHHCEELTGLDLSAWYSNQ